MTIEQLKEKYKNIPVEMQAMHRWVAYKIEEIDGRLTKVPYNAITGKKAASNDEKTWTTFSVACNGIIKYGFDGLGFMLGDGITGIDLDNHEDPVTGQLPMSEEEFKAFAQKFITKMCSYSELSQSGKGIHIICKGTLPEGRRRKGSVEMYSKGRFFACTGNVLLNEPVQDRQEELISLWKEYVDDGIDRTTPLTIVNSETRGEFDFSGPIATYGPSDLTDQEVIAKAMQSSSGIRFAKLYAGDMTDYANDHSEADSAFVFMLAFWCNKNVDQIDRIFRSSGLMRPKWDSARGSTTYGNIIINNALRSVNEGYVAPRENKQVAFAIKKEEQKNSNSLVVENYMNVDENGEPIFKVKQVYKNYSFTDTGNAERFYDQFGELFKYDKDSKMFMYWTGKTWVKDTKDIIRKYANKLAELMKDDAKRIEEQSKEAMDEGNEEESKKLLSIAKEARKNIDRMCNHAGKDAMLSELQSIYNIPVLHSDFNKDKFLLNTQSGIVDLRTGNISSFDRTKMLSKNTNCEVSFETPTTWIKFLQDIFFRGKTDSGKKETEEIIDFVQQSVYYSLTGSTKFQCMFILYGDGSNGKSTFINQLLRIMGDYANNIDSSTFMVKPGSNTSVQFSLANLIGCRFLVTKETNDGDRLDEGLVKGMTGGDVINAQEKFGRPFEFLPEFKPWMMTNNLPYIRDTTYGMWRRLMLIPFERKFADNEKDVDMPDKLLLETPKILGWAIQGGKKLAENGGILTMPNCLKEALQQYKEYNDSVAKFLDKCCRKNVNCRENCAELYNVFKKWGETTKEFTMRESKFLDKMISKGFKVETDEKTNERYYVGIEILSSARLNNNRSGYVPSDFDPFSR